MRSRPDGSHGFTLIELMIVVAIIGILAAIAIPNILRYQLKQAMQVEAHDIHTELVQRDKLDPYVAGYNEPHPDPCREGFRMGRGDRYFKCNVTSFPPPADDVRIIRLLHYAPTGEETRPFKVTARLKWDGGDEILYDDSYYHDYGRFGFPDDDTRWDF